jgi:hypothetical protein
MHLQYAECGVVDTDPLVTQPVMKITTYGHALPRIPSLADQILIATSGLQRNVGAAKGGNHIDHPEIEPDSCAEFVLARLRAEGDRGCEGPVLWEWISTEHRNREWSRSTLHSALVKLCGLHKIVSRPGRGNRRCYVAVAGVA